MNFLLLLVIFFLIESRTTEKIKAKCELESDDTSNQSCFLNNLLIEEDTELEIENSNETQNVKTIIYSESTLASIPPIDRKAFPEFETLEISASTITKFDKNFFKDTGDVKTLVLDGLQSLRMPVDFFEHLHKVEEILIEDCTLQHLTQPIFDTLKDHLKILTLNSNEIEVVGPTVLKNLNLQSGEFQDKCAENVKFPNNNLAVDLKTCYQNFETFSSKQVDKLGVELYNTIEKISAVEKTMNKKIVEFEGKLREEANKTEALKLNTNTTTKELSEMKQTMAQQIIELERKLHYDDAEIRALIQDKQLTIYCLIVLSLVGVLAFVFICYFIKKSSCGTQSDGFQLNGIGRWSPKNF
jgi:hypothetical protein